MKKIDNNLGQFHHIEIYVSNLQKSIEFWDWLLKKLGYQDYQKWDAGRSWKISDTYLVLVQAEKQYLDVPYHRKRVGLNHLAFRVDKKMLKEFRQNFESKGVSVLYKDKNFNDKLFVEDPDRIKIELASY